MGVYSMNQFNIIDQNIQIAGFNAEIDDLTELMNLINVLVAENECEGCVIQLLKADGIAGKKHVMQAVSQALIAFNRNDNVAQDLGLEICVRASAQRQISRALKILGIEEGKIGICAVTVDCDEKIMPQLHKIIGTKNNKVLDPNIDVLKKLYKISNKEIKSAGTIERVLIERTALLSLEI
jgi:KEOPS complex subunit Cgi121